jgi:hypothetical protein
MKRFVAVVLAFICTQAFGTTYMPPSLISTAGSTSGQVIISTGPTGLSHWASMTPAAIGGLTAASNLSDVANTATALANLGGLSTAAAASTYLTQATASSTYLTQTSAASTYGAKASPLSQFAATTSAQLAGIVSDGTGSGSAVFATSPTLTTPNIVGTANGTVAATGSVGEPITQSLTGTSLPNNTQTNCASKSLTAGSYIVAGVVNIAAGAGNTMTFPTGGVSTTSATLGAFGSFSQFGATFGAGASIYMPVPMIPLNLAGTTTVYLVGQATNTGTGTCGGSLTVVRIH